jgi:predicted secreted acid phosphatase
VFEQSKTVAARIAAANQSKALFGTRFIMLPNSMYGDWENSVYEYNFKLSSDEKAARRRSLLKSIDGNF